MLIYWYTLIDSNKMWCTCIFNYIRYGNFSVLKYWVLIIPTYKLEWTLSGAFNLTCPLVRHFNDSLLTFFITIIFKFLIAISVWFSFTRWMQTVCYGKLSSNTFRTWNFRWPFKISLRSQILCNSLNIITISTLLDT